MLPAFSIDNNMRICVKYQDDACVFYLPYDLLRKAQLSPDSEFEARIDSEGRIVLTAVPDMWQAVERLFSGPEENEESQCA